MKKIIAFAVAMAVLVCLFVVSFSVSADETVMTNQEYYAAQSYLIAKYKDGEISYSEYQQRSQAVTDEFVTNNTIGGVLQSGALNASNTVNAVAQKIGSTVQKYGDNARDYISDYVSDFFDDYTVLNEKPTIDLNGGVSVLYDYWAGKDDKRYYSVYYSSKPAELYYNDGQLSYMIYYDYWDQYSPNGVTRHDSSSTLVGGVSENRHVRYGQWVWREDGTQAPTDDTYETISDYDFSEAPERELEDLLKKVLDEFELKQPDLSSIEGLLNAIYARLGTLDSDNDNSLLSSINAAILALVKSNDDNNEELLSELLKFREDLKNGTVGTETTAHGHEISGTLYNVIPLDKNWLNKIFHDKENLKVQYEGKTYYLEDCGCLKLGDKYYTPNMNYDSYAKFDYDFSSDDDDIEHIIKLADENQSIFDIDFGSVNDFISSQNARSRKISAFSLRSTSNSDEAIFNNILTRSQNKKVNKAVDLVESFVNMGVPFESLRENFSVYEDIIFNTYLPKDLTFTVFDTNVILLRYSDFITDEGNETTSYTEPVAIVRAFSSILISFCWVFSMYKKMSNLI